MEEIKHRDRQPDKVQVLVSQILVWKPTKDSEYEDAPSIDKCLVINECVDIEIEDTYKKLINSAVVHFPRGTVVQRPLIDEAGKARGTSQAEGEETSNKIYTEYMDYGAIEDRYDGGAVAKPEDFRVGQRIQIRLGYYEEKFGSDAKARNQAIKEALSGTPDFDGYISQCSASSPIEIHCENIASVLKRKMCKYMPPRENVKVNDLFAPNKPGSKDKPDLLAGTGIQLYPKTKQCDISVGRIGIPEGWTVSDLLSTWEQNHLYSYIKYDNGKPYLAIGHTYFSGDIGSSILKYEEGSAYGTLIEFDYDVANDGLSLMHTDPLFFAVEAQSFTKDDKTFRVTIILNPDWDPDDPKSEKFRLVNQTNLSEKSMKFIGVSGDKIKEKVDLSRYQVEPYVSSVIGISKEDLIKEAKAYFESYNKNGVEGKLTIFGDYHLKCATRVALLDDRNPEKTGWYFVDEVTTKFGVNGFRQTINIPYCLGKPGDEKEKESKK